MYDCCNASVTHALTHARTHARTHSLTHSLTHLSLSTGSGYGALSDGFDSDFETASTPHHRGGFDSNQVLASTGDDVQAAHRSLGERARNQEDMQGSCNSNSNSGNCSSNVNSSSASTSNHALGDLALSNGQKRTSFSWFPRINVWPLASSRVPAVPAVLTPTATVSTAHVAKTDTGKPGKPSLKEDKEDSGGQAAGSISEHVSTGGDSAAGSGTCSTAGTQTTPYAPGAAPGVRDEDDVYCEKKKSARSLLISALLGKSVWWSFNPIFLKKCFCQSSFCFLFFLKLCNVYI